MNNRKAKPTAADIEAAKRLRRLWDDRLARAKTAGTSWSQESAGAEMGMTQGAVSQYLAGAIPLGYGAVLKFARFLGVAATDIRRDLESLPHEGAEDDWADVRGYAQAVGLGKGAQAQEYAETHKLKFKADSLRRKRLNPEKLSVMYGQGDSMEPRIRSGDAVLFDESDTTPRDGAIFIVLWKGEYYAKRCETLDDLIYFKSDHADGDHHWKKPKRMDASRDPIQIIGRVRWIGSWEG